MKIENKKTIAGLAGILSVVIIALIILSINYVPKGEMGDVPLPPDVVQLADGSWISLSHFYEMGYLAGTFDAVDYIGKQDVFKENTKAVIDLDTIFDKCHNKNKIFFDEWKKTNEYVDEQLKNK